MLSVPTLAACLLLAAHTYQLPPTVLNGIMQVEGGRLGQEVGPRFNGTYDLGPMQINSSWVPTLAQMWRVDYKTARRWVRDDACVNVHVAAWILKRNVAETGSLYEGMAYYHAGKRGHDGHLYARRVMVAMK